LSDEHKPIVTESQYQLFVILLLVIISKRNNTLGLMKITILLQY